MLSPTHDHRHARSQGASAETDGRPDGGAACASGSWVVGVVVGLLGLLAGCGGEVHERLELRLRDSEGRALAIERAVLVPRIGGPRELRPTEAGTLPRGEDAFYAGDRLLVAAAGHAPRLLELATRAELGLVLDPARALRGVVDCVRFPHLAGAELRVHGALLGHSVGPEPLASVETLVGRGATTLDPAAGFELDGLGRDLRWIELSAPEFWHGPLRLRFDEVWDPATRRLVFEGGGAEFVDLRGRVEPDGRGRRPSRVALTLAWDRPGRTSSSELDLVLDDAGCFRALVARPLLDRVVLAADGREPAVLEVPSLPAGPLEVWLRPAGVELLAARAGATRSRP